MKILLLLLFAAAPQYRQALPGYRYQFPRDHFEHPDFRTEWWYYTGNVHARDGHRYGFELVFFRQGERKGDPANASVWRIDDLYLAHLALTDDRPHQGDPNRAPERRFDRFAHVDDGSDDRGDSGGEVVSGRFRRTRTRDGLLRPPRNHVL